MSTFLGRWPLIPESYCDVDLPRDNLQTVTLDNGSLSPFTDRFLHTKAARLMASFVASPSSDHERTDPEMVSRRMSLFQAEIIDCLPPAFRLRDPDTSWDMAMPSLPRKREHLKATVHAIIAGLHRAFIDPWKGHTTDKGQGLLQQAIAQTELAESHHVTLADACSETILSIIRLHHLMGGGAHQLFFIPMALIEAAAVLGMCLLSARSQVIIKRRRSLSTGRGNVLVSMQPRFYHSFQEAFALLKVLSGRSLIAQKGVKVLQNLHDLVYSRVGMDLTTVDGSAGTGPPNSIAIPNPQAIEDEAVAGFDPAMLDPGIMPDPSTDWGVYDLTDAMFGDGGDARPGWATLALTPDQSWFFDDDIFTA